MKYEIIKQLKDAGFPNDWQSRCGHCGYDYGSNSPTLSELIEACGMPKVAGFISCSHGVWYASVKTKDNYGIEYQGRGLTPEEAVANLWLSLNKK